MTNQSRPLFAVGEEVILVSVQSPHCNGPAVVLDVDNNYEDEVPGYLLTTPCEKDDEGIDMLWDQSALRKKSPPSSQSFSELMNTLKSPEKV